MKLFGTDGIRGRPGLAPLDYKSIIQIAKASAFYFSQNNSDAPLSCILGKDTRISGSYIESALIEGFKRMGVVVKTVGILPTPAIAFLTLKEKCDFGIMITASHNLFYDNGIKFFTGLGRKLTIDGEKEITQYFNHKFEDRCQGSVEFFELAESNYINFLRQYSKDTFRSKIVLDCANGAVFKTAASIFSELSSNLHIINNQPNGYNINEKCGALYLDKLSALVIEKKADIGIAIDGDGDRLVLVDENGLKIEGEFLLAILASHYKPSCIVLSKVTNPALNLFLEKKGIKVVLTDVGDKNVMDAMYLNKSILGGEPSGHIILSEIINASDATITAIVIISILKKYGMKVSDLRKQFDLMPYKEENIDLCNAVYEEQDVQLLKNILDIDSTIILRKSGTENLLRVSLWNIDQSKLEKDYKILQKHLKINLTIF